MKLNLRFSEGPRGYTEGHGERGKLEGADKGLGSRRWMAQRASEGVDDQPAQSVKNHLQSSWVPNPSWTPGYCP